MFSVWYQVGRKLYLQGDNYQQATGKTMVLANEDSKQKMILLSYGV